MELLVYLLLCRRVCNIINAHDFMAKHTLIRASARFLRGNFEVGGVKNFLGEKKRFLRGNYPAKFPRPKFPQEILARILPVEKFLKPNFPGDKRKF